MAVTDTLPQLIQYEGLRFGQQILYVVVLHAAGGVWIKRDHRQSRYLADSSLISLRIDLTMRYQYSSDVGLKLKFYGEATSRHSL